ncbi:MAG: OmpA family protein [Rikenellaceae bacterium]|jgi:outer membrane protein OmpA-like peptidoglycan-associated protein|nr:OmpA family protein [Rikenellaceae bacterium]
MKKSLFFLLVFFTVSASVVSAQDVKVFEFNNPAREFKYGFISLTGGTQVYMGTFQDVRSLGDRMAPVMNASLGMMFNPYLGARIQWVGWNSYGTTNGATKFQGGALRESSKYYTNDFNLNYAHVDLLWNLSNTLGGPKESRFWDFVPYVGLGWVNANKVGHTPNNAFGIDAGLLNQLRLSPAVDIILDLRAMGTSAKLDGVKVSGGKPYDIAVSASLGVAYNFGRERKKVVVEEIDLTPYNTRISALESDLTASQDRAAKLARALEAEKAKEKSVINNVVSDLAVWFELGKSKLSQKEIINLGYVADAIKKAPADKIYTIFGSADKQTGSPLLNQRLSEQRAQAVYDALVKNGVNASQLRMQAVGDTKAVFDKPLLNRVAIVQNN